MLASNQAPLFDAHLHCLKALSDLRALPMKEVMRQLACVQAMYSVGILQRAFERPPVIASVVASIATARQCYMDYQHITPESDEHTLAMIGDACDKLAIAEQMALGAQSLLRKIPEGEECFQVINALVRGEEIDVKAERYRLALSLVAGMEEGGWRTPLIPSYREFVLEGFDSDRMNVKLGGELMRVVAGANSHGAGRPSRRRRSPVGAARWADAAAVAAPAMTTTRRSTRLLR